MMMMKAKDVQHRMIFFVLVSLIMCIFVAVTALQEVVVVLVLGKDDESEPLKLKWQDSPLVIQHPKTSSSSSSSCDIVCTSCGETSPSLLFSCHCFNWNISPPFARHQRDHLLPVQLVTLPLSRRSGDFKPHDNRSKSLTDDVAVGHYRLLSLPARRHVQRGPRKPEQISPSRTLHQQSATLFLRR